MRSMVLTGIRKMKEIEVPAPVLRRGGDVLIRIGAVGICGSDIHYYLTGRIGSQVVRYPFPVGHECAGTVARVGRGVRTLRQGDRVAVEPAVSCGKCDQCRTGRPHTCRKLTFLGCPGQADGCLSEYIVMPGECCFRISNPRVSFAEATLSEPLAIGIYAVEKAMPLSRSSSVAILGSGPIGLSVLAAARIAGVRSVYMTDKIQARLDMARRLGASWTGNPVRGDVVAAIMKREPRGMDAVFECCGKQEALDQAVDLLKPGGKLMVVGIPEADRVSFCPDKMRRREICIQNIRRQAHCTRRALDVVERNTGLVSPMITHHFPFGGIKKAFDLVAAYRDGVVKAVVDFDL